MTYRFNGGNEVTMHYSGSVLAICVNPKSITINTKSGLEAVRVSLGQLSDRKSVVNDSKIVLRRFGGALAKRHLLTEPFSAILKCLVMDAKS